MSRSEEYRRYAEECLRIARESTRPQERAMMLQMAQRWQQLAAKAEEDDGPAENN